MIRSFPAIACLAAMVSAVPALASPFCVDVIGLPASCIYADVSECSTRAQQLGGRCIANALEFRNLSGPGRYCLIESSNAVSCLYTDESSCQSDARVKHGACLDSAATSSNQDIFQGEPGRRY